MSKQVVLCCVQSGLVLVIKKSLVTYTSCNSSIENLWPYFRMYLIYVYIDIVLRSLLYDDDFWQMLTIKTYNITVVFEIYSCGSGLEDVCEIFVSWSSVGSWVLILTVKICHIIVMYQKPTLCHLTFMTTNSLCGELQQRSVVSCD